MTFLPWEMSHSDMALPIPLPPPVTIAHWNWRFFGAIVTVYMILFVRELRMTLTNPGKLSYRCNRLGKNVGTISQKQSIITSRVFLNVCFHSSSDVKLPMTYCTGRGPPDFPHWKTIKDGLARKNMS